MKKLRAVTGAEIFDSDSRHRGKALLLEGERVVGIVEESELPAGVEVCDSSGNLLVPGFIDLQVNGGGGVLLNDAPRCGDDPSYLHCPRSIRYNRIDADIDHRHSR